MKQEWDAKSAAIERTLRPISRPLKATYQDVKEEVTRKLRELRERSREMYDNNDYRIKDMHDWALESRDMAQ